VIRVLVIGIIFLFKKFLENENTKKFDEYLVISIPSYFLRKWKR